jgi:hypothetical protein
MIATAPALGTEVLRQVTRAAKRKRDADREYEQDHRPRRPARTLAARDRRRCAGLARPSGSNGADLSIRARQRAAHAARSPSMSAVSEVLPTSMHAT